MNLTLSKTGRERLLLAVLCLTAVAVRLGAVAAWSGLNSPPRPGSDELEYDTIAWNLVRGEGYRGVSPDVRGQHGALLEHTTAYRTPVTPLIYAAIYAVAGHNYAAAHVADSLIAGMTVLLIYAIGRRVFSPAAGWVASLLYTFYPQAIYYKLTLLSEVHGAFLICLFVWLTLPIKEHNGSKWATGSGLSLGALLLCKPGFVFLVPLLTVWAWAVCRSDLALYRRMALIPVFAGILMVPWVARNYAEFGKIIPFSTGGGSLLLQANNRIVATDPRCHGYAVWDTALPEYAPMLRATNDELERDALANRLAKEWLRDNPDRWFYLVRGKFWRLWSPTYFGKRHRELASIVCTYYGSILVVFAASVIPVTIWLWRNRDPALIMLFLILATVMTAIVFHGQHRYRFPIDSLCIVTAAGGITWLVQSVANGSLSERLSHIAWRRSIPLLACLALVAGLYLVARAADERRVNSIRTDLTNKQIQVIEEAVQAYRVENGDFPPRLEDLVPEYLSNAEALHCPTHSLDYHDYLLLGSTDPQAVAKLCSYRIEPIETSSEAVRVIQIHGQHSGGSEVGDP